MMKQSFRICKVDNCINSFISTKGKQFCDGCSKQRRIDLMNKYNKSKAGKKSIKKHRKTEKYKETKRKYSNRQLKNKEKIDNYVEQNIKYIEKLEEHNEDRPYWSDYDW